MRIVLQNERITLDQPTSPGEQALLNMIRRIHEVTGKPTVEFAVSSYSTGTKNDANGNLIIDKTISVSLEPVVPDGFMTNTDGDVFSVSDESERCHICGGPNHFS